MLIYPPPPPHHFFFFKFHINGTKNTNEKDSARILIFPPPPRSALLLYDSDVNAQ